MSSRTLSAFKLAAALLVAAGHPLRPFFGLAERPLLEGKSVYPHDHAAYLAQSALSYADTDPEIAVDIANAAFEISLREFAASWGIADAPSVSVGQLIETLAQSYDEDVPESNPYYEFRNGDGSVNEPLEERGLGESRVSPPRSLAQLEALLRPSAGESLPSVVRRYCLEIQRVVNSYSERSPLSVHPCLTRSWERIVARLGQQRPAPQLPDVDLARWEPRNFMGRRMFLVVKRGAQLPKWSADDMTCFLEVVAMVCGPIPEGVEVEFSDLTIDWL